MLRSEEDPDSFMYKFRTKVCTKKRCRNPSRCLNAHSQRMKRRVPFQNETGLFNYIPEPCLQWEKEKNCVKGDSCLRSHGWLEVIFHPLLYKTKFCKSHYKNGVCSEYGIYCAKAHNRNDVRNLVMIYGENWKRHYDLSLREDNARTFNFANSKCLGTDADEGVTLAGEMRPDNHVIRGRYSNGLNLQSTPVKRIMNMGVNHEDAQIDFNKMESPPLVTAFSRCCLSGRLNGFLVDDETTNYIDFYSEEPKDQNQEISGNSEDDTFQLSWNTTRCARSQSRTRRRSNWMMPLRDVHDEWKNCEPNESEKISKVECNFSDGCKKNVDPRMLNNVGDSVHLTGNWSHIGFCD